jgi:signal peptidase II
MSTTVRNRLLGFVFALLIFGADQYVKWVIDAKLGMRNGESIALLPIFSLTRTHNFGVSLGMFTAQSQEMRWGLVAVTSLIATGVTVWLLRERKLGDILPLGMVLGGALGNIRDRVRMGYVLDYADLHVRFIPRALCLNFENGECRPFLVFNIADACITTGVLIILARSLFMREKPPETQSRTHSEPAENPQAD